MLSFIVAFEWRALQCATLSSYTSLYSPIKHSIEREQSCVVAHEMLEKGQREHVNYVNNVLQMM